MNLHDIEKRHDFLVLDYARKIADGQEDHILIHNIFSGYYEFRGVPEPARLKIIDS